MGEVGFPGGFVVGSGLANKHSTILPEKQGVLLKNKIMALHNKFPENKKHEHIIINVL